MTVRSALETAGRGIPQEGAAETLMLWLAGPYRLDRQTGWLFAEAEYSEGQVGPRSEVGPPPRSSLLEAVTDEGVVSIEAARLARSPPGLYPPPSRTGSSCALSETWTGNWFSGKETLQIRRQWFSRS